MATIAITGASGFVGTALAESLRAAGHTVLRFTRPGSAGSAGTGRIDWDPATGAIDRDAAAAVDAVVHLAGANVAAGRWTAARKRAIQDSRGPATERLCRSLAALPRPPVLLSASATGIYGDRGDEPLVEDSAPGRGFLAEVAAAWERGTAPLEQQGARVVHLRIGVVLGPGGGALAKMLPAFRLGLGGRLGGGRQFMSWIALDDLLGAIAFLLQRDDARGPVLCVAPQPVTNREFTRELGRALRRPALLPVPAFALRLLFGQMADEALLASQRAMPGRLLQLGYAFRHPELASALRAALRN
ncbi:MAG: TIGR01777 family oxidoreductase [Planctomycetota bacterium]